MEDVDRVEVFLLFLLGAMHSTCRDATPAGASWKYTYLRWRRLQNTGYNSMGLGFYLENEEESQKVIARVRDVVVREMKEAQVLCW